MAKKLVFSLLTVVLLFSLLLGAPACAPAKEEIELTAISMWPMGDELNIWFEKWVEEVNKRGEGELEIDFVGGPEVVSMFEATEIVSKGIYDMGFLAPPIHFPVVPEGSITSFATYFVDPAKIRETGLTARLDEIYREKVGLTWIGSAESGHGLAIFTSKEFTQLADLEGQKCRVVPMWKPMIDALGMIPTSIPTEELYEAFEKGIVDAMVFPLGPSIRELGVSPLAKCVILPCLPMGTYVPVMMHAERFDSLPEHLQKLMLGTLEGLDVKAYNYYREMMEAEKEILKGMGVEMAQVPAEEVDTYLRKTAEALYDYWLNACPEYGPELLDMVKDHLVKVD